MLRRKKIDRLSCEIATLIYDQYMIEAYGITSCDINYTRGDLSEKIIEKSILDFGVDCDSFPMFRDRKELQVEPIVIPHIGYNFTYQGPPNPKNPVETVNKVIYIPAKDNHQFIQPYPVTVWYIDYPLGFQPNVTIVDTNGFPIEGSIQYLYQDASKGRIAITFSEPTQGAAYLS